MERVRADISFDLEAIDITGVDELEARYRERIPVLLIDGEEAFELLVDETELSRYLARVQA